MPDITEKARAGAAAAAAALRNNKALRRVVVAPDEAEAAADTAVADGAMWEAVAACARRRHQKRSVLGTTPSTAAAAAAAAATAAAEVHASECRPGVYTDTARRIATFSALAAAAEEGAAVGDDGGSRHPLRRSVSVGGRLRCASERHPSSTVDGVTRAGLRERALFARLPTVGTRRAQRRAEQEERGCGGGHAGDAGAGSTHREPLTPRAARRLRAEVVALGRRGDEALRGRGFDRDEALLRPPPPQPQPQQPSSLPRSPALSSPRTPSARVPSHKRETLVRGPAKGSLPLGAAGYVLSRVVAAAGESGGGTTGRAADGGCGGGVLLFSDEAGGAAAGGGGPPPPPPSSDSVGGEHVRAHRACLDALRRGLPHWAAQLREVQERRGGGVPPPPPPPPQPPPSSFSGGAVVGETEAAAVVLTPSPVDLALGEADAYVGRGGGGAGERTRDAAAPKLVFPPRPLSAPAGGREGAVPPPPPPPPPPASGLDFRPEAYHHALRSLPESVPQNWRRGAAQEALPPPPPQPPSRRSSAASESLSRSASFATFDPPLAAVTEAAQQVAAATAAADDQALPFRALQRSNSLRRASAGSAEALSMVPCSPRRGGDEAAEDGDLAAPASVSMPAATLVVSALAVASLATTAGQKTNQPVSRAPAAAAAPSTRLPVRGAKKRAGGASGAVDAGASGQAVGYSGGLTVTPVASPAAAPLTPKAKTKAKAKAERDGGDRRPPPSPARAVSPPSPADRLRVLASLRQVPEAAQKGGVWAPGTKAVVVEAPPLHASPKTTPAPPPPPPLKAAAAPPPPPPVTREDATAPASPPAASSPPPSVAAAAACRSHDGRDDGDAPPPVLQRSATHPAPALAAAQLLSGGRTRGPKPLPASKSEAAAGTRGSGSTGSSSSSSRRRRLSRANTVPAVSVEALWGEGGGGFSSSPQEGRRGPGDECGESNLAEYVTAVLAAVDHARHAVCAAAVAVACVVLAGFSAAARKRLKKATRSVITCVKHEVSSTAAAAAAEARRCDVPMLRRGFGHLACAPQSSVPLERPGNELLQQSRGTLRAVVVGAGLYKDSRLLPCHQACHDAVALAIILRAAGYGVTELHDASPLLPTKPNILHALASAREACPEPDDVCVFVFVGYGHYTSSCDAPPAAQRPLELHLFSSEYEPGRRSNPLATGEIRVSELLACGSEALPPPVVICDTVSFYGRLRRAPEAPRGGNHGCVFVGGRPGVGGTLLAQCGRRYNYLATFYLKKGLLGHATRDGRVTTNSLNVFLERKLRQRGFDNVQTGAMSLSVGDVVLVERHEVAYDKKELEDRGRQAGAQPAKIYLGCFVSRTRFDAANDHPPFAAAVHHALRRLCRPGDRRLSSQRPSLHLAGDAPTTAPAAAASPPPPPLAPPRLKTLAVAHSRLRRSTAASGDRTPRASARRSRLVSTAEAAADAAASAAAAAGAATAAEAAAGAGGGGGGGGLVRRRSSLFGAGFGLPQLPSVVRQVYSHRATVLLLEGNEAALQRCSAAASRVVEALRERLNDPTAHLCPFLYKGRLLLQVHSRFLKDNTDFDNFLQPPDDDDASGASDAAAASAGFRPLSASVPRASNAFARFQQLDEEGRPVGGGSVDAAAAASCRRQSSLGSSDVWGPHPAAVSPRGGRGGRRRSTVRGGGGPQRRALDRRAVDGHRLADASDYVELTIDGSAKHFNKLDRAVRGGELASVLVPFSLRMLPVDARSVREDAAATAAQAAWRGCRHRMRWRPARAVVTGEAQARAALEEEAEALFPELFETMLRSEREGVAVQEAELRADKELWEWEERELMYHAAARNLFRMAQRGMQGLWDAAGRAHVPHLEEHGRLALLTEQHCEYRFASRLAKLWEAYRVGRETVQRDEHYGQTRLEWRLATAVRPDQH